MFSTNRIQYDPQRDSNLTGASHITAKRNSSPFENELKEKFDAQFRRRVSCSTPSDSDGENEFANVTTCPSKNLPSHLSSNDTSKGYEKFIGYQYPLFENVIQEEDDLNEPSPFPRKGKRKNSVTEGLDIISK